MNQHETVALIARALTSDFGIEIAVDDATSARGRINYIKNLLLSQPGADPALRLLEVRGHPTDPKLMWLVKGSGNPGGRTSAFLAARAARRTLSLAEVDALANIPLEDLP